MKFLEELEEETAHVNAEDLKQQEADQKALLQNAQNAQNAQVHSVHKEKEEKEEKNTIPEPKKDSENINEEIDEELINEATAINADIQAAWIEAPFFIWNFILLILLKRKIKKKYTDPAIIEKKILELKATLKNNEEEIFLGKDERELIEHSARRKAIKENGKVREGKQKFSFYMRAVSKRLGLFNIPEV
ncbi:MAG TPA: hypothetical protein VNG53_01065 [Bacteroidia bacterium]|nr:hypothetical protein [Bacteroidia bacterium]